MTGPDAIGGYFELELPQPGPFLHERAILLNTGRSCFEHVIAAARARRVLLPDYTCDVMLEPLRKLGIEHRFYAVEESLEIAGSPDPAPGELLVYTNYFGLKGEYCRHLAKRHGDRLVLDCSQALFFPPPEECHSFYSPRKFVGVPDGGCLYTPWSLAAPVANDASHERYSALVGRIDMGPEAAYAAFKAREAALADLPILGMSASTRRLLRLIDFDAVAQRRRENFARLHDALGARNRLVLDLGDEDVPMVYPYWTDDPNLRERLRSVRIFVGTYWPNVFDWCREGELALELARNLLPLPIDQRYGPGAMDRIVATAVDAPPALL